MGFDTVRGLDGSGAHIDNTVGSNGASKNDIRVSEILFPDKKYEYKLRRPKFRRKQVDAMVPEVDDSVRARYTTSYHEESKPLAEMFGSNKSSTIRRLFKKREYEHRPDVGESIQAPFDVIDWERDLEEQGCLSRVDIKTRELINNIFEEEKWEDQVIYDEQCMSRFKPFLTMWLNDPNLIFDAREDRKRGKRRLKDAASTAKPSRSKYNISNDKYYDFEVTTKSSLGIHGVQHSILALKLHPDFYKTNFTNDELRCLHRLPLKLEAGRYRFQALREPELKTSTIIKKPSELELSVDSNFQLLEYSEEFPPLVQNVGMVSLINNYFRKGSQLEEPPIDKYQSVILEAEDPSPFFGYGDVRPGESMLAITNNLFKAPLFRHKSKDFLCIRHGKDLYLRKIEDVLLVGQVLPSDVCYSPNSRKYNVFCKNRLKNTVYRFFNSDENHSGIPFHVVDNLFSHFSEGSKRKWLKEFAEVVKRGRENFWTLKAGEAVLSEEDLRKLVTPENVCQYESMLAAERRLLDMGYDVSEQFEDEHEMRVAPWNLTKNFVSVCNGKGLLELEGIGDPTGIGEGFSFVKVKLKKGNEAEDRKFFAEVQAKYKNTIQKIWGKQVESLSSARDIPYDEVRDRFEKKEATKAETVQDDKRPYIVIKRVFLVNNERVTEEEKVYDAKVIDGYLKCRKQIKTEDKKNLRCGSCGQPGHMKTNKICPKFSEKKVTKKTKESLKRRAKIMLMEKQLALVNHFFAMQYSGAFHRPVSTKKFPDYRNFILRPMDLSMIRSKVKAFKYRTFNDFLDDVSLVRDNCRTYNGAEHSLTKIAQAMVDFAHESYAEDRGEIEQAERLLCDTSTGDTTQSL